MVQLRVGNNDKCLNFDDCNLSVKIQKVARSLEPFPRRLCANVTSRQTRSSALIGTCVQTGLPVLCTYVRTTQSHMLYAYVWLPMYINAPNNFLHRIIVQEVSCKAQHDTQGDRISPEDPGV